MSRELIASYTRKDFRIDTFCAGGPGGQHQNKTQSGVRITHLLSGLSVESREFKSQHQNKSAAFKRLGELVRLWHVDKEQKERVISNECVRTYHEKDNRVKDHLTGEQQSYTDVEKDISHMIESRRKRFRETE